MLFFMDPFVFEEREKFAAFEAECCFTSQEVRAHRSSPYAEPHLFIEMSSKLAI